MTDAVIDSEPRGSLYEPETALSTSSSSLKSRRQSSR
jgi:hypothetical protein